MRSTLSNLAVLLAGLALGLAAPLESLAQPFGGQGALGPPPGGGPPFGGPPHGGGPGFGGPPPGRGPGFGGPPPGNFPARGQRMRQFLEEQGMEAPEMVEYIRALQLKEALDLSREQTLTLMDIGDKRRKFMQEHAENRREKVQELGDLLEGDLTTQEEPRAGEILGELRAMEREVFEKEQALRDELAQSLTIEQQARYHITRRSLDRRIRQLMEQGRQQGRMGRGPLGPGMGRGMGPGGARFGRGPGPGGPPFGGGFGPGGRPTGGAAEQPPLP